MDDEELKTNATSISESTLKGKDVYRLGVPAVIKDYEERFIGREKCTFSGDPLQSSVVVGSTGSKSSWAVDAKRGSDGESTDFYLVFSSETDLTLKVEHCLRLYTNVPNCIMMEYDIYQDEVICRSQRMYLGSIDDRSIKDNDWLCNGSLYTFANVLFKIESAESPREEKAGDRFQSSFKDEIHNPVYGDFILVASGEQIKTHKMILGLISPVFRAMFATDCQETRDGVCKVEDAAGEVVKALLDCALGFADVEKLDFKRLQQVFSLADKYQVEPLRQHCIAELIRWINMRNVIDILVLADKHSVLELKNEAFIFLEDNCEEVFMNNTAMDLLERGRELDRPLYQDWNDHMNLRRYGKWPKDSVQTADEAEEKSEREGTEQK